MMRDSSVDRQAAPVHSMATGATVTVCWCGTDGVLAPATTQVGLFFMLTQAQDISHSANGHGSDDRGAEELARILSSSARAGARLHLKMGFDGCGQTNGCTGTIFASGLVDQCRCVIQRVEHLLTHLADRGDCSPVVLNVLGLSRGGMAAMKLSQMLAAFDPKLLEVNLCLFDPGESEHTQMLLDRNRSTFDPYFLELILCAEPTVPGNLLISATLDHFLGGCFTTARQCMDLGASRNLRRCLAIYPHVPLPSCAFHAPIVPLYPALTEVTELVTLECHQGAFFAPDFQEPSPLNGSLGHSLINFLLECCAVLTAKVACCSRSRHSTGPTTRSSRAHASQCDLRVCCLSSVFRNSWRAVGPSCKRTRASNSPQ